MSHKRHGFNPWVGRILQRRARQPTPVFLSGEFHEQQSWWAIVHRVAKSWTWWKWLSMHMYVCVCVCVCVYVCVCVCISSVAQSCPTLCNPMDCSTPGIPVHHQLLELTQTHVHRVGDAIQPSHPLSFPSPPTFNLSQHQSFFQWVSSSHEVANVLEFQL